MKDTGINFFGDDLKIQKQPLSQQAKTAVLQYIQKMDLKKDTKLPREEVMAQMLGVSRITVRNAFADLAAEGIIFRKQGKGTFVNVHSMDMKVTFNPVMEYTQMIEKSGYKPTMELLKLEIEKGRNDIRKSLRLKDSETMIRADKAFFADGKLCVFCSDYYGLRIAGGEENFNKLSHWEKSMFPYIYENFGTKLTWDMVEIDTAISTKIKDFAEYLKAKKVGLKPYLYLREISYGEDNEPLIYVDEYIDTSIIKYNMIRQKNINYSNSEELVLPKQQRENTEE